MTPETRAKLLELAGWQKADHDGRFYCPPDEDIYSGKPWVAVRGPMPQWVGEQVADAVLPFGWIMEYWPGCNEPYNCAYGSLASHRHKWPNRGPSATTRAEAIEAMLDLWMEVRG